MKIITPLYYFLWKEGRIYPRAFQRRKELIKNENLLAKDLQTEDIFAATHKAREKSMKLLEEQGITTVALALSKILVEFTEHPEEVLKKVVG